jgi:hypothetical protein
VSTAADDSAVSEAPRQAAAFTPPRHSSVTQENSTSVNALPPVPPRPPVTVAAAAPAAPASTATDAPSREKVAVLGLSQPLAATSPVHTPVKSAVSGALSATRASSESLPVAGASPQNGRFAGQANSAPAETSFADALASANKGARAQDGGAVPAERYTSMSSQPVADFTVASSSSARKAPQTQQSLPTEWRQRGDTAFSADHAEGSHYAASLSEEPARVRREVPTRQEQQPFRAGTARTGRDIVHKEADLDESFASVRQAVRPVTSKELDDALALLKYDVHREVQDVIREQIRQFAIAKVSCLPCSCRFLYLCC